jgi:hypothetical protein
LNVEFNKLLVPTPQIPVPQPATDLNGDGDTLDPGEPANDGTAKANNDYRGIGWTSGVFKSFGDASDGFSEELKEVTYAVGAEYLYQDSFAMFAVISRKSCERCSTIFLPWSRFQIQRSQSRCFCIYFQRLK